jgi:glyoxylase-like metal-dependent hydrolase (beta-lactamase superfamily II)
VKSGTDYILIDTGIGLHVPGMAGALPQKLASIGVEPEEISKIFITHLHADHIGGAFAPPTESRRDPRGFRQWIGINHIIPKAIDMLEVTSQVQRSAA